MFWPVGGIIAVLSYIDESLDEQEMEIYSLGLIFAAENKWTKFENAWKNFLRDYSISEFKTSAFFGKYDTKDAEFSKWSPERNEACRKSIIKLFDEFSLGIIDVTMNILDCREATELYDIQDNYHLCLQYVFIEAINQTPPGEHMSFILDRRQKTLEKADEMLFALKDSQDFLNRDRVGTVASDDSKRFLPLQAADIIAHRAFKLRSKRYDILPQIKSHIVHSCHLSAANIGMILKELESLRAIKLR